MHLYSLFAQEVHRDWLAQQERDAELRRLLPKRERRGLPHISLSAPRFRRQPRPGPHGC